MCLSATLLSQQVPPDSRPQGTFKSGIDVVQLDVSVFEKDRRPIRGLTPGDFHGPRERQAAADGVAQGSGHDIHRLAGEKREDVVDRKGQAGFSGLGSDACGMRREHDIGQ